MIRTLQRVKKGYVTNEPIRPPRVEIMPVYVAYVKESFGKETRHGVMFPCQENSRDAPTRGSPQFLASVLYSITVENTSMTKWFTIMVTFKYSAGS